MTSTLPHTVPIPDSYWVIPGRLLAGEYPGAKDAAGAVLKLGRFRDAGITLFFDLTEAGEHGLRPYALFLLEAFGPNSNSLYSPTPR